LLAPISFAKFSSKMPNRNRPDPPSASTFTPRTTTERARGGFTFTLLIIIILLNCVRPPGIAGASDRGTEPSISIRRAAGFVPGEVLVKFRPGVSAERIDWILNVIGGQTRDFIATIGLYRVRIAHPDKVTDAVTVLQGFAEVEYAEPNLLESQPAPQ
jgi:hypothetical protein